MRTGDRKEHRHGDQQHQHDDRLESELSPREPRHDAPPFRTHEFSTLFFGLGHVRQDQVLEGQRLDAPRRIEDRIVTRHDDRGLALGVTHFDDVRRRRQRVEVAPSSDETMVRGQEIFDFAVHLHSRGGEDDQVVTDALEIGNEMRTQDDADLVVSHDLHQRGQELTTGQGVERRHRFVQQEE